MKRLKEAKVPRASKLSEEARKDILENLSGLTCKELSRKYGIADATISQIRNKARFERLWSK